ncbi:MAG: hypothetical protein ACREXR_12630, partial [Gammaproteobacteria bacterium]
MSITKYTPVVRIFKHAELAYQQSEQFLSLLAEGEPCTFQTLSDKGNDSSLVRSFHGTFEQHAAELKRLNDAGAGIFVVT